LIFLGPKIIETREEIGCDVVSERYYQTFVGPSSDNQKTVVMICFFIELGQQCAGSGVPEPKVSAEIEELYWANSTTTKEMLGSLLREHVIPALHADDLVD